MTPNQEKARKKATEKAVATDRRKRAAKLTSTRRTRKDQEQRVQLAPLDELDQRRIRRELDRQNEGIFSLAYAVGIVMLIGFIIVGGCWLIAAWWSANGRPL